MAKVAFSKLKLTKQDTVKTIKVNDVEIEVKQYLPITEKINIITNVLQESADANNFANPMKVEVFLNLEMIYAYTNLTFTDKQKEDVTKLYDLLETNDVINEIIGAIPESEYSALINWTNETIDAFYKYRNSMLGILNQISEDYSNLNYDAGEIQGKLADPNNLELLKAVLTKLG